MSFFLGFRLLQMQQHTSMKARILTSTSMLPTAMIEANSTKLIPWNDCWSVSVASVDVSELHDITPSCFTIIEQYGSTR